MLVSMATNLKLPLETAAAQTYGFLGRKGSGKSYAAGKLVELLLGYSVQVIILDVVGNWFGIRMLKDGKPSPFDIPVLGGLRGDIPLDPATGELIADIAIETGRSLILDVSQFSKGDRQRFAAAFGERLWLKKKGETHPSPMHLVLEESQLIVPQDVRGDTARMVGTFEEIIRLGRNYGIGVSMISQRPQSVNKEVLNQVECLFVFQTNGPQERDALKKWIVHHGADTKLVDQLPSLPIGTAYVWSPQWLGILERVQVLPKITLDATATPTVGGNKVKRVLKPLDLKDLEARMVATIEKARADDPKILKRKIAALQQEIDKLKTAPVKAAEPIEVPFLDEEDRALLVRLDVEFQLAQTKLTSLLQESATVLARVVVRADALDVGARMPSTGVAVGPGPDRPRGRTTSTYDKTDSKPEINPLGIKNPISGDLARHGVVAGEFLPRIFSAMLTALAQHPRGLTKGQLLLHAGYKSSGTTSKAFAEIERNGWWQSAGSGAFVITEDGRSALGPWVPLPTGQALRLKLLNDSSPVEGAILRVLFEAYPDSVAKGRILEQANYKSSGTTSKAFARLVRLGYANKAAQGQLVAAEELFE